MDEYGTDRPLADQLAAACARTTKMTDAADEAMAAIADLERSGLTLGWIRRTGLSILSHRRAWAREMTPPERDTPDPETREPAPAKPDATGPSLQVVPAIDMPQSEYGSVAAAYRSLTEPLPLHGGGIAPETLRTALSLEFPHMTEAVITSPWSNGQTEGQITKLKLVKRQMYGRGKIDLLEARVVGSADG